MVLHCGGGSGEGKKREKNVGMIFEIVVQLHIVWEIGR